MSTITLISSDKKLFKVEEAVATEMTFVKNFVYDLTADSPVPLRNVSSQELSKIIAYIKKFLEIKGKQDSDDDIKAYSEEFVKEQSSQELMQLMKAVACLENINFL